DHGLLAFEDAERELAAAVAVVGDVGRAATGRRVEGVGATREVGTGAKASAPPGDDDRTHVVIGVGAVEGVDHFVLHLPGERVELFRAVEGDGKDAIGIEFVSHLSVIHWCSGLLLCAARKTRHARAYAWNSVA